MSIDEGVSKSLIARVPSYVSRFLHWSACASAYMLFEQMRYRHEIKTNLQICENLLYKAVVRT